MPDRLAELRRQRALVAEHLAWLDRQIAEAGGEPGLAFLPTPDVTNPPIAKPVPKTEAAAVVAAALKASAAIAAAPATAESPETAATANAILDEYRVAPDQMKTDLRKGCFLYFFLALALVGLGVAGLWLLFRHS